MEPARKGIRWRPLGESPAPALLEAASKAPKDGTILKESPVRLVCRVRAGEQSAVVKIHPARGLFSRLAALLGVDPARREARALQAALQAGLPAPRPLATGLGPSGETRLLLEDLGEGSTLADFLFKDKWLPDDRLLEAARLTARLHKAGILHPDLHPGNLLFPGDGTGPFVLDLQAARPKRRPLTPKEREKSLTFLWLSGGKFFSLLLSSSFLEAYLEVFPWPAPIEPFLLKSRLKEKARRLQRKVWVRREDRPFRTCSEFLRTREGERLVLRARYGNPPTPEQVQTLLREGKLHYLRKGRRGFVARGGGWILKERDRAHARALWLAHYRLRQRGIPAPEALLLVLDKKRGLLVGRDLGPLPDLARALEEASDPKRRKDLVEKAGILAAALHGRGLRNRDLKAANLLVRETKDGPQLLPVDLDGVSRPRRIRPAHMAADLARLAASLSARDIPWRPLLKIYSRALELEGFDSLPPVDSLEKRILARLERLGPRP